MAALLTNTITIVELAAPLLTSWNKRLPEGEQEVQ